MAHSKYSDDTVNDEGSGIQEHRLNFGNDNRAYTPSTAEKDAEGIHGNLAAISCGSGDWSWRPWMHQQDPGYIFSPLDLGMLECDMYQEDPIRTADLEHQMPTYRVCHA